MFCLILLLHTSWMTGAHRGQNRVLNHLKVELQMVLCHHVCAGNLTWLLYKSKKCPKLLSHPSTLLLFYTIKAANPKCGANSVNLIDIIPHYHGRRLNNLFQLCLHACLPLDSRSRHVNNAITIMVSNFVGSA